MLLPEVFPTPQDTERISVIKKYQLLYENKQFEVLGLHELIKKQFKSLSQLIYVAHAIPAKVSEFYGDFVQGDVVDMVIESTGDEKEGKKTQEIVDWNDLKEAIYDYSVEQSSIGYVVLLARVEEGQVVIDSIPQDQYFPQKDGSVIFASYIEKPDAKDPKKDVWLYIQHYKLENDKAVIERSLWEVNSAGKKGEQVDLSAYDSAVQQREDLGIDELPIVQINNGRKKQGIFGRSDYADILPQISEINERTTQVAIQLLKNLDAKMEVPKGVLDEEGNARQFEIIERESKETPETRYIINENPLIDDTYKHVERQVNYISWFTGVPMFELLSTSTQPERVEALRIRLFAAVRKTDTKRAQIKKGVDWILRVGLKLLGIKEPKPIRVEFSDVLPVDVITIAQAEEIKVRNGLTSRRSSIKRLENYDEERIEEELQLIESENAVAGINTNLPPQI